MNAQKSSLSYFLFHLFSTTFSLLLIWVWLCLLYWLILIIRITLCRICSIVILSSFSEKAPYWLSCTNQLFGSLLSQCIHSLISWVVTVRRRCFVRVFSACCTISEHRHWFGRVGVRVERLFFVINLIINIVFHISEHH